MLRSAKEEKTCYGFESGIEFESEAVCDTGTKKVRGRESLK